MSIENDGAANEMTPLSPVWADALQVAAYLTEASSPSLQNTQKKLNLFATNAIAQEDHWRLRGCKTSTEELCSRPSAIAIIEQLESKLDGMVPKDSSLQPVGVTAQADNGITDTDRLNFMLKACRKVTVERIPGSHYEIYVEEGFMSDVCYQEVIYKGDSWDNESDIAEDLKRQAIDAAIVEYRSQDS